jgi:hypothetical protein
MGNSLIMLVVVVTVLRGYNIPFDLLVDGDNAIVFMRGCDAGRVTSCFAADALSLSGHEMVLERQCRVVEEVRFGQCAPVELVPGSWSMVRDWKKVASQITSSHAHMDQPAFIPRYLRGVALCEMSLNVGVPVIGNLARTLFRATESYRAVEGSFYRDYGYLGVELASLEMAKFVEPAPIARESFARAFGVSIPEQLQLERDLSIPADWATNLQVWCPEESPWEYAHLLDSRPGLVEPFYGVVG